MSGKGILCGSVAVLFAALPVSAHADEQYAKQVEKARAYFLMLREGKYDECVAAGDDAMKSALPAEKLAEVWKQITETFGEYQGEIRAEPAPAGEYISVNLISKFAASPLAVHVTVNHDGAVAGLFFAPSSEGVEYQPPDYVDKSKFHEESATVSAGELELPGTLTLPNAGAPFSAIVLVHGSGPHDQDETIFTTKPFKDIAWGLATRGVAVLRYEKRTRKHGASMDPHTITIDTETADDAEAAARLLMARDDIRSDRVFVCGHSLGASAAPYIGVKEPKIAGLIMIGAAARHIYDLVEDQTLYITQLDGEPDEAGRKEIEEVRDAVAKMRNGTWKEGDTLLGAPAAYWAALDRMNSVENAKKWTKPMLIIQGGRDYQVTTKEYAIWQRELSGHDNVTMQLFEPLDHLMHTGTGPSRPQDYQRSGYVDVAVIDALARWIKAQQ